MVVICKFCNKEYSSYSSRSNHIKKYHSEQRFPNVFKCIHEGIPKSIQNGIHENVIKRDVLTCKFCNKKYSTRQNRWKHEKICKEQHSTHSTNIVIEKLKQQLEEIKINQKNEINKIKKELLISLYNNKVNVKEIYEKINEIEL